MCAWHAWLLHVRVVVLRLLVSIEKTWHNRSSFLQTGQWSCMLSRSKRWLLLGNWLWSFDWLSPRIVWRDRSVWIIRLYFCKLDNLHVRPDVQLLRRPRQLSCLVSWNSWLQTVLSHQWTQNCPIYIFNNSQERLRVWLCLKIRIWSILKGRHSLQI